MTDMGGSEGNLPFPTLFSFGGSLYYAYNASSGTTHSANLAVWNGVNAWTVLVAPSAIRHVSLQSFNGELVATENGLNLYHFPGLSSEASAATLAQTNMGLVAAGARTFVFYRDVGTLYELVSPSSSMMLPAFVPGL